jgi:YfiR/HmsC-like
MALLGADSRRSRILASALALAISSTLSSEAVAGGPVLEDAVKATYIYKFAPFVAWPAPLPTGASFVICTIGSDRVSALLPQVVEGQRIDDRAIRIRALAEGEPAGDCRVLYIAAPFAAAPLLDSLRGKPVLTVTSSAETHGIIQLVTASQHVSFDIDARLASEDGLEISSKLLGLARNVTKPAESRP